MPFKYCQRQLFSLRTWCWQVVYSWLFSCWAYHCTIGFVLFHFCNRHSKKQSRANEIEEFNSKQKCRFFWGGIYILPWMRCNKEQQFCRRQKKKNHIPVQVSLVLEDTWCNSLTELWACSWLTLYHEVIVTMSTHLGIYWSSLTSGGGGSVSNILHTTVGEDVRIVYMPFWKILLELFYILKELMMDCIACTTSSYPKSAEQ